MQKFLGIGYDKDFIDVDWTIITFCNYKCDYCYARNSDAIKWNQILTKNQIDECFCSFKQSKHKINLNILGGEPTLHPEIDYIIGRANDDDVFNRVSVITNNNKLIKLPKKYNKLLIVCTYHGYSIKNDDIFLKNLEYYSKLGIETRVSIMADDRFLGKIKNIYERIKNIKTSEIEISYIIQNDKYQKNSLDKPNLKKYSLNKKHISINEIYNNNLNKFKGWNCRRGYMFININGDINGNCFNYKKNIFKNKNFFKNFNPIFLKCEKEFCPFDCYIAQPKVLY